MKSPLEELIQSFEQGRISRRSLLRAIPALALAPSVIAAGTQADKAPIRARKLNHFTLNVSDVKRSVDFYQGLFGMPVQARQGSTVCLRIGPGPQYLALAPAGSNPPSIDRSFGLNMEGFNAESVVRALAPHGITPGDAGSDAVGPMKARIKMRGTTPELFFGDPDGIVVQIQDSTYSGGGGPLGAVATPEPSPAKGLIALHDWSHCTIFSGNGDRSNAFYQEVFGFPVQSHQGPTAPTLGVGDKVQFLMLAGGGARGGRGGGAAQGPTANINHICMNLEGFNPDNVIRTLDSYGVKPRVGNAGTPPLISYISLRMENRGGAPGGTPELYFTDPDGLLLQLQDVKYCGGGGFLGEVCTG
jgi:catechol 2,3-dioxygenase-like lactoylglutathione lyase family enzyme